MSASFFEVARHQRAHHKFTSAPVPDAVVEQVLEYATYAPSAENRQPWVFVVVRDDEIRARIAAITERLWNGGARAFSESRLSPELLAEVDQGMLGDQGYRAAPVVVVICADLERCLPETVGSSIYPAAQNLLLAAGALGLGSAFTTLVASTGAELQDLLGLPEHITPQVVVPLGYPPRPLGLSRRDPAQARTHRDRYGTPW